MPRLKKVLESHNNKLHVKKDDTVIVITGKDKGKKGRVIAAYPRENRVLVEGVNMVKKHTRPSQQNPQGGIIEPPRSADSRIERDACRPEDRQADADRLQGAGERQESTGREAFRRSHRLIRKTKGGPLEEWQYD